MPMPETTQILAGGGSGEVFSSVASLVGTCITAVSMIVAARLRFAQADLRRARRSPPHKAMPRRTDNWLSPKPRFGRKARAAPTPAQRRRRRSFLSCFAVKDHRGGGGAGGARRKHQE